MSSRNYDLAMVLAEELASSLVSPAAAFQIADQIDHFVGVWVQTATGPRMSWPHAIALAAGRPNRHIEEEVSR